MPDSAPPVRLQVSRSGARPVPGAFSLAPSAAAAAEEAAPPAAPSSLSAAVTSVAFHPSAPALFLAGFEDGSVALFTTGHALPLAAWGAPWQQRGRAPDKTAISNPTDARQRAVTPVVRVAWVPGRQSAFVAVDADGWLGAWDLLTSTAAALSCTRVVAAGGVVGADVCGATTLAKTAVTVLVATETGVVEAALGADLTAFRPGEARALRLLISRKHL